MTSPTRDEQRRLVLQWEVTGRELDQIRRDALRGMEYNWVDVDALLEMADHCEAKPRSTSGLVEMQRWFIKAARRLTQSEPDPLISPTVTDCEGREGNGT